MPQRFDVDGNAYVFPDDWTVFIYDEWAFYRTKLMPEPMKAKGCDLVAFNDEELFLIEAKDYSRPDSKPWPGVQTLAKTVTLKGLHTMAGLLAGAKSGGEHSEVCERAIRRDRVRLCLAVEFADAKRRVTPATLVQLRDAIKREAKFLRHAPLVANYEVGDKPWTSSRTWHLRTGS